MRGKKEIRNPWVGLASYQEPLPGQGTYLFCGRDQAIKEVVSLIDDNLFLLLYGGTGVGKTSLLNAGVFPVMRQRNYLPLYIRLGLYDIDKSFEEVIVNCVREEMAKYSCRIETTQELDCRDEDYLWKFFFSSTFYNSRGEIVYPLIVLDQFEEVFIRRKKDAWELLLQIYKLIDDTQIIDASQGFHSETNFRFVASIREDYLYKLEECIDAQHLTEMLYCRFRLASMSPEEAESVILLPGKGLIKTDDEASVVKRILEIATIKNEGTISSLLLSLACSQLCQIAYGLGDSVIGIRHLAYLNDNPLAYLYEIAELKLNRKQISFIESNFIDAEGKRTLVLKQRFDEKLSGCEYLSSGDVRIFNSIKTSDNVTYIELIHDLLALAVYSRREERKLRRNQNYFRFLLLPFLVFIAVLLVSIVPKRDFEAESAWSFLMDIRYDNKDEYLTINNGDDLPICANIKYINDSLKREIVNNNTLERVFVESINVGKLNLCLSKCPNLRELRFSDSITMIPEGAVLDCNKLKIHIHAGIVDIHPNAFSSHNIEFIVDPANPYFIYSDGILWDLRQNFSPILYVPEQIVLECSAIPFVDRYANLDTIQYRDKVFSNYNNEGVRLVVEKDSLLQPSYSYRFAEIIDLSDFTKIKEIPAECFKHCERLEKVQLPPNLETIGHGAFAECKRLKQIKFPKSLSSIGARAFAGCESLDSISFSGISMIGIYDFAFHNCANLVYVKFPDRLCYLGRAFVDCSKLECVELGDVFSYNSLAFQRCVSLMGFLGYCPDFRSKDDPIERDISVPGVPDSFAAKIDKSNGVARIYHLVNNEPHIVGDIRSLKEIYLPFPTPIIKAKGEIFGLRIIDIHESLKKDIVLTVPKGCSVNYKNHPDFQGYKEIREATSLNRMADIMHYRLQQIINFRDAGVRLRLIYLVLVFCILCFVSYKSRGKVLYSLLSAVYSTFIIFLVWQCLTLLVAFYLEATVIGYVIAVLIVVLVLLLLCALERMTIVEIWRNRRSVLRQIELDVKVYSSLFLKCVHRHIYITIILAIVALGVVFVLVEQKKTETKTETKTEIIKRWKDERDDKCISMIFDNMSVRDIVRSKEVMDIIRVHKVFRGHGSVVDAVAFSPDGSRIVTGSRDSTAMLWDAESGNRIYCLSNHRGDVRSVAFSPGGSSIITGSWDKTAMIWDVESCDVIDTLSGHNSFIDAVAFSPDGSRIVTGSRDKTAIVWDAQSGVALDTLSGHRDNVTAVAFAPDGRRILTASSDSTAIIWDVESGDRIATLSGHNDRIISAAISPDGTRIITGSRDNTAMIWDAESGAVLDTLTGHRERVMAVAFSPDGKRVVTGSLDYTAMIWDVGSGDVVDTLSGYCGVYSVAFSPDGKYVATGHFDGIFMIWNLKGHFTSDRKFVKNIKTNYRKG